MAKSQAQKQREKKAKAIKAEQAKAEKVSPNGDGPQEMSLEQMEAELADRVNLIASEENVVKQYGTWQKFLDNTNVLTGIVIGMKKKQDK